MNVKVRVRNLVRKYGTRDPFKLAVFLGITVDYKPYKELKGYFTNIKGNKTIVINSNLTDEEKLIVMAHELAHAVLHSSKHAVFLREYTLFPRGKQEIEANKYAAELLIDETNIDKHFLVDFDLDQIAAYLNVPKQLVEYKFKVKKL